MQDKVKLSPCGYTVEADGDVRYEGHITPDPTGVQHFAVDGALRATYDRKHNILRVAPGIKVVAKPEEWKKSEPYECIVIPEIPKGTVCFRAPGTAVSMGAKAVLRDGKILGCYGSLTDFFYFDPALTFPKAVKFTKGDKWIEVRDDGRVTISKTMKTQHPWTPVSRIDGEPSVYLDEVRVIGNTLWDGNYDLLRDLDDKVYHDSCGFYTFVKEGE